MRPLLPPPHLISLLLLTLSISTTSAPLPKPDIASLLSAISNQINHAIPVGTIPTSLAADPINASSSSTTQSPQSTTAVVFNPKVVLNPKKPLRRRWPEEDTMHGSERTTGLFGLLKDLLESAASKSWRGEARHAEPYQIVVESMEDEENYATVPSFRILPRLVINPKVPVNPKAHTTPAPASTSIPAIYVFVNPKVSNPKAHVMITATSSPISTTTTSTISLPAKYSLPTGAALNPKDSITPIYVAKPVYTGKPTHPGEPPITRSTA